MYIEYLKKNYNNMRAIRDDLYAINSKFIHPISLIMELYEESTHREVVQLIHCLEDLYALVKIVIPSTFNTSKVKDCLLRLLNDRYVLHKLYTSASNTTLSEHLTPARREIIIDVLLTLPHTAHYFFTTADQAINIISEMVMRADPRAKDVLKEIYRSPKTKVLFSNTDLFLSKVFAHIQPESRYVILQSINESNEQLPHESDQQLLDESDQQLLDESDQQLLHESNQQLLHESNHQELYRVLEQDLIGPDNDPNWSTNEKEEMINYLKRT